MASLSQLIMNVGGLSGNSYDRQKALYERLGSPMGAYTGSYNQNNWLLQNQGRWGTPNPTTAAPVSTNPYDQLKQTVLNSQILREIKPYEESNPFTNFFNEDLVRGTYKQLFQPEFKRVDDQALEAYNKNVDTTNQGYANSGALFGGARLGGLGELMKQKEQQDFERQREQNRTIESQVMNEKTFKQKQYEDEKNRYLTNPQYR